MDEQEVQGINDANETDRILRDIKAERRRRYNNIYSK